MKQVIEYQFSGANLTAIGDVFSVRIPVAGEISSIFLWSKPGEPNAAGNNVFNFAKNGVNMYVGGDRLTLPTNSETATINGYAEPIDRGDVLTVKLETMAAGGVKTPLTIIFVIDDYNTGATNVGAGEDLAMGYDIVVDKILLKGIDNGVGVDVATSGGNNDTILVSLANYSLIAEKIIPIAADFILIEDTAAAGVKKKIKISSLPSSGQGGGNSGVAYSFFDPDAPSVVPDSLDDDFNSTALDAKWTAKDITTQVPDFASIFGTVRLPVVDTAVRSYVQPVSGNWKVRTKVSIELANTVSAYELVAGLAVYGSSGSNVEVYALRSDTNDGFDLRAENWTGLGSFGSQGFITTELIANTYYLELEWNGSILSYRYSLNGKEFLLLFSKSITFTPAFVGITSRGTVAAQGKKATFEWFRKVPESGITGNKREAIIGGTALPSGDLNASTNKLEKIQGRSILVAPLPVSLGYDFNSSAQLADWDTSNLPAGTVIDTAGNLLNIRFPSNGADGGYKFYSRTPVFDFRGKWISAKVISGNTDPAAFFALYLFIDTNNWVRVDSTGSGAILTMNQSGSVSTAGSSGSGIRSNVIWKILHNAVSGNIEFYTAPVVTPTVFTLQASISFGSVNFAATQFRILTKWDTNGLVVQYDDVASNIGADDALLDKSLLWYKAANSRIENVSLADLRTALAIPTGGGAALAADQAGIPSDSPSVSGGYPIRFDDAANKLWLFNGVTWIWFSLSGNVGFPIGLPFWAGYEADSMTVADGADATAWTDLSGNTKNMGIGGTAPVKRIVSGVHYFDFTPGGWFTLPDMSALTQAEVMFILKTDNDPATSGTTGRLHNIGTGIEDNYYPWTDGNVYDGLGSTQRKSVQANFVKTNLHCYSVQAKTNFWKALFNGEERHFIQSNTVVFNSTPTIGKNNSAGTFAGRMTALYVFSKVLTESQRLRMQEYITTKHGIIFG